MAAPAPAAAHELPADWQARLRRGLMAVPEHRLEHCRPAFGLGQQGLQILRRQVVPEAVPEELRGFVFIESQLFGFQLEHLTPYAKRA